MHHVSASELERNVRLFRWFQIFSDPLFWGPVVIFYIMKIGHMSLEQYCGMEAVIMLLLAALQIPTGALADHVGRRKVLIVGTAFIFSGVAVLAAASSPVGVWVSNILVTSGFAFCSGTDQAMLRGSLEEIECRKKMRSRIFQANGRAHSWRYLVSAGCGFAAGWLYELNPSLPMVLSLPGIIVAHIIAWRFVEPNPRDNDEESGSEDEVLVNLKEYFGTMSRGVKEVVNSRMLLWLMAIAVTLEVSSKIWFTSYNSYFETVGIRVGNFGTIFGGLNLTAWYFSRRAARIEERLGERNCAVLLLVSIGAPMVLMGIFVHPLAAILVLTQNACRGIARPFYAAVQSHYASAARTATIDSVRSCVVALGAFGGLKLFQSAIRSYPLTDCLWLAGLLMLVAGAGLMVWYGRIQRREGV